jgi:hypothetical protein
MPQLELIQPSTDIAIEFSRSNLATLARFFDLDFVNDSQGQKETYFQNLERLSRRSLGLAHNIQHSQTAELFVKLGQCQASHDRVLNQPFGSVIGCYSVVKRTDDMTLNNSQLDGVKKWFSNLAAADYAVMQVTVNNTPQVVYVDLAQVPHRVDHSAFDPIGMELARPGSLIIDHQAIAPDTVLGQAGTQQFFLQSSFASYCFLTNHLGITRQLFLDIKHYAEQHQCGAEFELKKLEMDICTMQVMWEDNLATLDQTELTHAFWNRRNTQYAFSKKTLIGVVQLILELGVSYYTNAHGEFSQRFRDALTYCTHMHPLYRFGQDFYMVDLAK